MPIELPVRDWSERWKHVRPLPGGGQGSTNVVRRCGATDGPLFVLKTLNRPRDPDRRGRMFREATALRTVKHRQVPALIDTNVEFYEDNSVDLYLVMEFAGDKRMADLTAPCSIDDAIRCITPILDTVHYCHGIPLIHRDLKPDNVILRNGDFVDPVIIDFGMSFNAADESEFSTQSGKRLGNGTLHLPELMTTGADQRNQLTDISFCVGLFFFLLTNRYAESLVDASGDGPHKREPMQATLAKHPPKQLAQLNRIFTIGLAGDFNHRFRSIDELRREIDRLTDPALGARKPLSDRLKEMNDELGQDPVHAARAIAADINQELTAACIRSVGAVMATFAGKVHASFIQPTTDQRQRYITGVHLAHTHFQTRTDIKMGTGLQGLEIVLWSAAPTAREVPGRAVFGRVEPTLTEYLRINVFDPDAKTRVTDAFEDYFSDQMSVWQRSLK